MPRHLQAAVVRVEAEWEEDVVDYEGFEARIGRLYGLVRRIPLV